jgi:hypothetical protein
MGFLNQTTNNIIVDAVLTDLGRQFLARNDGSFNIVKFALADNEVDYTIIEQYGTNVGKDKIEKNTPVFEASTNSNIALKYKLVSISNPALTYMPAISISFVNATVDAVSNIVSISRLSQNPTFDIQINQTSQNNNLITPELIDNSFEVRLNDLFLGLQGFVPDSIDANNNSVYIVDRSAALTTSGGSSARFTLRLKTFSQTLFDNYKSSGLNVVRSYVRITGINSGAVKEFEVRIS